MCVLIFSTFLSETFLILRGIQRHTSKYVYWPPCQILKNLNFLDRFSKKKNYQISICIKSRPLGAEPVHEDGLTDMTQLIVAFRNFANTPKNKTMTGASITKCLPTFLHKHVTAKIT